uniref:Uncharacterized protein n=1 Tax=Craspedostauros australis TaxID=1486917 RepID=A0A7R9WWI0_9STRA
MRCLYSPLRNRALMDQSSEVPIARTIHMIYVYSMYVEIHSMHTGTRTTKRTPSVPPPASYPVSPPLSPSWNGVSSSSETSPSIPPVQCIELASDGRGVDVNVDVTASNAIGPSCFSGVCMETCSTGGGRG